MMHPEFYDEAPTLRVFDPLSAFLGAVEDGIVEYTYLDAVKLAGHSCPTVAGAYLMTLKALRRLYGEALPVRGEIEVHCRGRADEGTTGVVANVAALLTGALAQVARVAGPDEVAVTIGHRAQDGSARGTGARDGRDW